MVMWANYATMSNICADLLDTFLNKYKYGFFILVFLGRENTVTRIFYSLYLAQKVSLQSVLKFRFRSSVERRAPLSVLKQSPSAKVL